MLCPFKKKITKEYIYSEDDTSVVVEENITETFGSCSKEKCPFYSLSISENSVEKCRRTGA